MADSPLIERLRQEKPEDFTPFYHDGDVWIPEVLRKNLQWIRIEIKYNADKDKWQKRPVGSIYRAGKPYNPSLSGLILNKSRYGVVVFDWDRDPIDEYAEFVHKFREMLDNTTYTCRSLSGLLRDDEDRKHNYLLGSLGTKKIDLTATLGCEILVNNIPVTCSGIGNKLEPYYNQDFLNDFLMNTATKLDERSKYHIEGTKPDLKKKTFTGKVYSPEHYDGEPRGTEADAVTVRYLLSRFLADEFDPCPENNAFVPLAYAINHALGVDETLKFMEQLPSWSPDAANRIRSLAPDSSGVGYVVNLAKKAVKSNEITVDWSKAGFKSKKTRREEPPPDGKIPIPSELGYQNGFRYCLEELGFAVRYHELQDIQVRFPGEERWRKLDDQVLSSLSVDYVAKSYVIKTRGSWVAFEVSRSIRMEVIETMASGSSPVNPTRDWLKTIEAKEDWGAIDTIVNCYKIDCYFRLSSAGYTGEQINEYYRFYFVIRFAGIILRSTRPGSLFDLLGVMVGEEGVGKGLGLQLTLEPQGMDEDGDVIPNEAYKSGCRLSADRDAWFHNRQCSFGEIGELVGLNTIDNERAKSIISDTHDHIEHKFKNYKQSYPKTYHLEGTTNIEKFKSPDNKGGRRFVIGDFDFGIEGGKEGVKREMPKRLNSEWRRAAFGHVKWLIEAKQLWSCWSPEVEKMRALMVEESQRGYQNLESVLLKISSMFLRGTINHETRFAFFDLPNREQILKYGLPIDNSKLPNNLPTWMRLFLEIAPIPMHVYRNNLETAMKSLGWTIIKGSRCYMGYPHCRKWAIPRGVQPLITDRVDKPELTDVPKKKYDKDGNTLEFADGTPRAPYSKDSQHPPKDGRQSDRELDELYLQQKREAQKREKEGEDDDNSDSTD